jgi:hypothetical protein
MNGNGGESIGFRVYNHDTSKEYAVANAPVAFAANDMRGDGDTPYFINISDAITQEIALNAQGC